MSRTDCGESMSGEMIVILAVSVTWARLILTSN